MKMIFVVEDNVFYGEMLKEHLQQHNVQVKVFTSGADCIAHLYLQPHVVLLDYFLEGELNGMDVLLKAKAMSPFTQVVFLTAQQQLQTALNALRLGAFDYIEKNDNTLQQIDEVLLRIEAYNRISNSLQPSFFDNVKQRFKNFMFRFHFPA